MPQPRKVSTKKRATILDHTLRVLGKEHDRVMNLIEDLEKDHVDDKAKAKVLLKSAKRVLASIAKAIG